MSDFYSAAVAVAPSGPATKVVESAGVDRLFISTVQNAADILVGYNSTDLYVPLNMLYQASSLGGFVIPAGEELWMLHMSGGAPITVNFILTVAVKNIGIGITTC